MFFYLSLFDEDGGIFFCEAFWGLTNFKSLLNSIICEIEILGLFYKASKPGSLKTK